MNAEQPGSWGFVEGKAVPMIGQAYAVPNWKYLSEGSSGGKTLSSGHYYVTNSVTFSNSNTSGSGLSIAGGATVHLYIPKGITLTANGANASGRNGAGAGILLPYGSTLYLEGGGTVNATGGNAADGGDGRNGGDASADDSNCKWIHPGDGGAGGDGGGGAGAGIGTRGGNGGSGGSSVGRGKITSFAKTNFDGITGKNGGSGETASSMGNLYVDQSSNLHVNAKGGTAATYNGRAGGTGTRHLHRSTTWDHTVGPGSGGGGGGFGGKANDIGTGGPGGGGGGSGSSGTTRYGSKWKSGWFSAGSKGGGGGQDANGNWANRASDAVYDGARGWEDGNDNRASGGNGGGRGGESQSLPTKYDFLVKYNVMYQFGGSVNKTIEAGYKSNVNPTSITISIPTHYAQGLIQQDKYLEQWNTRSDGTGSWHTAGYSYRLSRGTTNLYAEWNDYKDIFPEGYGSKSKPFIIKDAQLLSLADYVNSGCNTRGVYFKQQHDIIVSNILSNNNRGSQFTPIGHACVFEGDYDGGGYLIRNGEIASKVDNQDLFAVGIFGKVLGSVHNLGVETLTIKKPGNDYTRCGVIAGMLVSEDFEQRAGQMRDCYSYNNNVSANYAGCLVGEMSERTGISHCLESTNTLSSNHGAAFSSLGNKDVTIEKCYTSGGLLTSNGYSGTDCKTNINATVMASGEITWLLNDNSAFATTWYQNVDKGVHDAHPVLNTASSRVYHEGTKYSNEAIGTISLPGKGLKDDPYLVKDKDDLEKLATFCNSGNNSAGMHFLQTADIDLKGGGLTPIGNPGSFAGIYDGDGHTKQLVHWVSSVTSRVR